MQHVMNDGHVNAAFSKDYVQVYDSQEGSGIDPVTLVAPFSRSNASCAFWHICDIHLDPFYSQGAAAGPNKHWKCHAENTGGYEKAGAVGSYYCDASPLLVESSIEAMKAVEPNPEFIILGGDYLGHAEPGTTDAFIPTVIAAVSARVALHFPHSRVFPMLGNHDVSLQHLQGWMPPGHSWVFQEAGKIWKDWLSAQALSSFLKGGYYTELIRPGLRIIVLNSVLFYAANHALDGSSNRDPNGMIAWLVQVLKNSRGRAETVILAGHLNPGNNERTGSIVDRSFYNQIFVDAIEPYLDIIPVQLYGHLHADSFRVFRNSTGTPLSVGFVSPSVDPWYNLYNGKYNSVNPGVRLFEYSFAKNTFELTDYYQLYANLEEMNAVMANGSSVLRWRLEYSARDAYGLRSLTAVHWAELVDRLRKNDELFSLYRKYNSVSIKEVHPPGLYPCDDRCRKVHLCALNTVRHVEFNDCMK